MATQDDERGTDGPDDEVTRRGPEALVTKFHAPRPGALRTGRVMQRT